MFIPSMEVFFSPLFVQKRFDGIVFHFLTLLIILLVGQCRSKLSLKIGDEGFAMVDLHIESDNGNPASA